VMRSLGVPGLWECPSEIEGRLLGLYLEVLCT